MNLKIDTLRLRSPICITWQITSRCNLRCIHCLAGEESKLNELSVDQAKDFINDLAGMNVFYINVGGGEPLLHPNFFEIMDYAHEKGVYAQFSTNGTLIESKIAAEISKSNLRVQVSLDGWAATVNDSIRGAGTYKKAIEAIRVLCEKKVITAVNCVVTKQTIAGLDQMLALANLYGAKLRLSRLRPSGRAKDLWQELAPSREQYIQLYQWLRNHPEVNTGDSFFFLSPLGPPLPGLSYCGAGKLTCSVSPQGDVYPCPFTVDPSLVVGNVKENPLSQLWREAELFRKMCSDKPKACLACPSFDNCRGGCRGASYLVYDNWDMPDPECVKGEK